MTVDPWDVYAQWERDMETVVEDFAGTLEFDVRSDMFARERQLIEDATAEGERRGREAERRECLAIISDHVDLTDPECPAGIAWTKIRDRYDTITSLDVLARIERETTGEGE